MTMPEPTFLGYFVKRCALRPEWLRAPRVRVICSVSDCVSKEPAQKFVKWGLNSAGYYNKPAEALAVPEEAERTSYTPMALALFPVEFTKAGMAAMPAADFVGSAGESLPAGPTPQYRRVGLDVTSGARAEVGGMARFDCSPLSCNSMAGRFPVNEFCLLDDWDAARAAALEFARDEPEPGPYYILAVYAEGAIGEPASRHGSERAVT